MIEHAPDAFVEGNLFYLPHRPVIRENQAATKIRMVFDGSSSVSGPSLNNCLNPGPSLTSALFAVLLRFRGKNIGLKADLEKAFLQISLNENDRDFNNISMVQRY